VHNARKFQLTAALRLTNRGACESDRIQGWRPDADFSDRIGSSIAASRTAQKAATSAEEVASLGIISAGG
jgi:hypothetical protein